MALPLPTPEIPGSTTTTLSKTKIYGVWKNIRKRHLSSNTPLHPDWIDSAKLDSIIESMKSQKFGMLSVIEFMGSADHERQWLCCGEG